MTPEDIKKLPTPETDAEEAWNERAGLPCSYSSARDLEQRLAAAVMALEEIAKMHISGYVKGCPECEGRETLASIRSMK